MMKLMKMSLLLALCVTLTACSHFRSKPDADIEPTMVDVRVSGLKSQDADRLEEELNEIDGVKNVRRDPFGKGETVFTFEYSGSHDNLRSAISGIDYPGLRPGSSTLRLQYEGFDNRAPKITVLSPATDELITEESATVVVQVEDEDVDEVRVNDVKAKPREKGMYEASIELKDGQNPVKVLAVDEAGNEAKQEFELEVDTTPPEVDATVKVVVEGNVESGSTVFVDGKEADVNMFGKWKIELKVKKGQKEVEVVAIDKAGNKQTQMKSIGF